MLITHNLVRLSLALLARPQDEHWGYDLSQRTGIETGALYPMLRRLESRGWLSGRLADDDEQTAGRKRRYYRLTRLGVHEVGQVVLQAQNNPRFRVWVSEGVRAP